jgi:hypothetical protein
MLNLVQIPGNGDPVLTLSATGTGASPITFIHNSAAEGGRPAQLYPAVFLFAITDIVGPFSALQVNLEWSPITPTGTPQFQTIGTWTPLTNPTAFFPCSSTGQYRLNCTSFTGGTSFNVYASIAASMPQSSGSGGVSDHVIVDSGSITVSGSVTANAQAVYNTTQPSPSAGAAVPLQADQAGNLLTMPGNSSKLGITWSSSTSTGTLQYPNGTATPGGPIAASAVIISFSSTANSGAVTFEGTYDGVNYFQINASQIFSPISLVQAGTNPLSFTSGNIQYMILMQGMQNMRLNLSTAITSGTVTPTFIVGNFAPGVLVQNTPTVLVQNTPTVLIKDTNAQKITTNQISMGSTTGALDMNMVGVSGSTMAVTNPLITEISDGTTGPVAVKAAGTPAASTDKAFVVSLSPNSPVSISAGGAAVEWTGLNLAGINPAHVVLIDSSGSGVVPAIKAASTAAIATDPSLVVALSPNSPVPTGSNTIGKVDILGNAGATLDAAGDNQTAPGAELVVGGIFNSNTGTASALTAGNVARIQLDNHGLILADNASINGSAIVTAAAGIQKVGISDSVGTTLNSVVKGTQAANALGVQDLKDSGRTYVTLTADAVTPASSETVLTFAKNVGGTVTTGVTTYAVTAGKTLRIQAIFATLMQSSTTVVGCRLRLRHNTAGAATATSPLVATIQLGTPASSAVAGTGVAPQDIAIPDGLEIKQNGNDNITLSAIATSAAGTLSVTLIGYEY